VTRRPIELREGRLVYLGADAAVRQALTEAIGRAPEAELPRDLQRDDIVVVAAFENMPVVQDRDAGIAWVNAAAAGGNAFSACRSLKENRLASVFVVALAGDVVAAELARFVLADGTLWFDRAAGRLDATAMQQPQRAGSRRIEELHKRLQGVLAEHSDRSQSALERLLQFEREDDLMSRLQDPETGLFDGPYAALKLDEEWKRATRFHSPLALLLLEIEGTEGLPKGPARQATLAEVAGVFLNECRDIDVLARFNETTFMFLLPGTGLDGASVLARRMLDSLRERTFGPGLRLRPAAGLAVIPAAGIGDRRTFLSVAEACLMRARAQGGDSPLATDWE
jgi:GGDEF domain-containing protein